MRTSHPYKVYMSTYLLVRLFYWPYSNSKCKLTASCFWNGSDMLTYLIQSSLPLPFFILMFCADFIAKPSHTIKYCCNPLFNYWKPPENNSSICSLWYFNTVLLGGLQIHLIVDFCIFYVIGFPTENTQKLNQNHFFLCHSFVPLCWGSK